MNKKQKIVIAGLAVILVGLIIAIGCLSNRQIEPIVNDFVAPEFDGGAVSGIPSGVEKDLDYRTFSVEEKIHIGMCGNLKLKDDNTVDIYFTSDSRNTFWSKIKLMDGDGNLLGESGLIKPGEYVQTVMLTNPPKKSMSIAAKVLTYEENTYYSKGSVPVQMYLNVE